MSFLLLKERGERTEDIYRNKIFVIEDLEYKVILTFYFSFLFFNCMTLYRCRIIFAV